jgi:ADP-ribosylglycohydrolase
MHNVLDPRDWVPDELAQRASSGYHTDDIAPLVAAAAQRQDRPELLALAGRLAQLPRRDDWRFVEPDDAGSLADGLPADDGCPPWSQPLDRLRERLLGAWLGRCVGCCLGKPVEGLSRQEIETYARAAGAYPVVDYLPLLDPLPAGVRRLHESAPVAAAGRFDATPRDDDLDWTILNLSLLEEAGEFDTERVAAAWLDRLPFTQTFTAERAAYRNLIHGIRPPQTAVVDNPYREWIGALIRADAFGYVSPGRPGRAVRMALRDARLSHRGNGIYGEMWAAALVASAFTAADARGALDNALRFVPATSRLHAALVRTADLFDKDLDWHEAMDVLDEEYGHYDWVHTINNATHIAAGLLWGGGDFTRTVSLTVQAGADTDSAGATAGSVFGALHGAGAVPARLAAPLNDRVRSAISGFDRIRISELADRTLAVARSVLS